MKAVFVSTGYQLFDDYPNPSHGTSIQIWGIAKELAKKGHDILITARSTREGLVTHDRVKILNLKLRIKDNIANELISRMSFSVRVAKCLENIQPDMVYLRDRVSGFFPARLDIPSVFTVNSPDACDFFKSYAIAHNKANALVFPYKKCLEENILSNVNEIIAMNRYIKEYLINKGFMNVRIIHGGVDPKEFLNVGDDNFILYAGRIDWNRQVDLLIKSFSNIKEKYDVNLKIIGTSFHMTREERYLKSLVKARKLQDFVEFIPWIKRAELLGYMSRCTVLVLPSLFENHPNVVMEAMASGKPVVASDTMGAKELITHGYDGYLFYKNRPEELKKYLEICISNSELRGEIGKNARKTIEKNFHISKIADEYIEIYNELPLK